MSKDDNSWRGSPCICGDKDTWHPECYTRTTLDLSKALKSLVARKIIATRTEYVAELLMEIEKLHEAMAGLQDMEAEAKFRTMEFESCVRKMMAAEMAMDIKEWLALHHQLYALMQSPNV